MAAWEMVGDVTHGHGAKNVAAALALLRLELVWPATKTNGGAGKVLTAASRLLASCLPGLVVVAAPGAGRDGRGNCFDHRRPASFILAPNPDDARPGHLPFRAAKAGSMWTTCPKSK
jgi:hypothetical protein